MEQQKRLGDRQFQPVPPAPGETTDLTNGGPFLFLAYNNPNYNAQIIAISLAAKW